MAISYQSDGSPIYAGRFPVVTALSVLADSMSSGDVETLTTNGLNTLVGGFYPNEADLGGAKIMCDWSGRTMYDPINKQAVECGAPAGALSDLGVSTTNLKYDEATNAWSAERNPFSQSMSHCWYSTTIDGNTNTLYKAGFTGSKPLEIKRYDVTSDTELTAISYPVQSYSDIHAIQMWHERGVSGGVIHLNPQRDELQFWDLDTEAWNPAGFPIATVTVDILNPIVTRHEQSGKIIWGCDDGVGLGVLDTDLTTITTGIVPVTISNDFMAQYMFLENPNKTNEMLLIGSSSKGDLVYPLNIDTGVWGSSYTLPVGLISSDFIVKTSGFTVVESGVIAFQTYIFGGNSIMQLWKP